MIFCGDEPLLQVGASNTSSGDVPQVTECFQHTALILVPCAFLWLFFPLVLYALYKSNNGRLQRYSPITFRIGACVLLLVDVGILLAISFIRHISDGTTSAARVGFLVLLYATLALAAVLTLACRNRGVIASGVLFNFWLLLALCGFPEFRYRLATATAVNGGEKFDSAAFYLYMAYYPLVVAIWLLSCFADLPVYRVENEKACPESGISFLNAITFNWFNDMAILGHRRALEMDDLWELNKRDRSDHLVAKFERTWLKCTKDFKERAAAAAVGKKAPRSKGLPTNGATEMQSLNPPPEAESTAPPPAACPPSLIWPLFLTFKWPFLGGAFYKLVFDLLQFVSPQLLRELISFIEDRDQPMWRGVSIAVLMFGVALGQSMLLHQYFHQMFRLGMNIRSVLTASVYKKALLLSNTARKNRTIGEIVNLMAIDVQRFQDITSFVMQFWSSPLQVLLSIFFLWRLLGVAIGAGLAVLVLLIPLNTFIASKMRDCQVQQMRFKDERLKLMSEMLNGIKVLKLYAWEQSMEKRILDIRQKEIQVLRRQAYLNTATALSWSCAPFLVAVLTFGTYVTIDPENNVLTPQITFVGLALFNILRFPLAIFAMITSQAVQTAVSNRRLKTFLAEEEIDPKGNWGGSAGGRNAPVEEAISMHNATFSWDRDMDPTLNDLSFSIAKGSLVAVVGRIGSGKSSLLSAILGEMHRLGGQGTATLRGSVAYVPQQAWIQNLTLKQNVLFGKQFYEEKYQQVLSACALLPDLETLPAGDQTEIGEKGINLSGGQKQRVSLARACYSESEVYLLDDPLSAVDAHVGRHLFEQVIGSKGGLLGGKTRVFVTHSLPFLKHCDQIIVMKEGRISECGTYERLLTDMGEFANLLEEFLIEETQKRARSVSFGEEAVDEIEEVLGAIAKVDPSKKQQLQRQMSQISESIKRSQSPPATPTTNGGAVGLLNRQKSIPGAGADKAHQLEKAPLLPPSQQPLVKTAPSKIIEKELIQLGKVKMSVYNSYIRAIGYVVSTAFLVIYFLSSILGVGSNLWLADWSDHAREIQTPVNGSSWEGNWETHKRLGIYTLLGMGQALFVALASIIMALGMVRAGRILHEGMLKNILRSPMTFFDTTPLGRILNRFGKDVDAVDSRVPGTLLNFVGCAVQSMVTCAVPMIVTPQVSLPLIAVLCLYLYVMDVDAVDATLPRFLLAFIRMVFMSADTIDRVVGRRNDGSLWYHHTIVLILIATPSFAFVVAPLTLIYASVLRFYVSTSRQLKRLESTTRSPIYSHFQESVQGVSSIRAYQCADRFLHESQNRLDHNMVAYYPSIVANRWLAVRLEFVGNVIVLCSALFAAIFRDSVTAGLVGLSVSYALSVTQTLNWTVRMTSELEANIVSVERIEEYITTPTEAPSESGGDTKVAEDWPSQGEIVMEELTLRYRPELDLVLSGVTAHINAKEKIGIVGRTGAGKSSLTLALFRIVEPAGGRIVIDGVDISQLGLNTLRSRLTIVPQDPVMISGTIRENLDPFQQYDTSAVWEVLKLTSMDSYVSSLVDKMEHKLNEGGENLSVGQRQLICLARALLRKPKILILDEAAASVDMETDQLIQKTIREQFHDCTVLTIAHRLHSVMESDRIMVFEGGRVAEFDAPRVLLAREGSLFKALAEDAGITVIQPTVGK